ncbi:MAG: TIM barrel protein [Proteobacteria bacterium]|nr:TIM barrel protein [Pseudomonadota bacterium]
MSVASFEPVFMPVGVLTAALQELTPRERRDPDPDLAVEEWLDFARELEVECIQLSAALHPERADVPAEAMLDPVANTLDLREPFTRERARRVEAAVRASGVEIADLGYFDDMLHWDPEIRARKREFMLRVFDAAVLLGVPAVCGFVGRNQRKSMDENLLDFEESFVPLLQEARARGLEYRVEQCPMPGWTVGDSFHNNIAYTPGTWIALHRICERHGVGDQWRIHYDPSHAILMGQDTRSIFQYLKDEGYGFLITGFHVKGQVVDARGLAAWGYGGQTLERGDWKDGRPSPDPADQGKAWAKQSAICEHELPGTARHDPLAYLQNRSVDWLDHQLAARELLELDPAKTPLIIEHEYGPARVQDKHALKPILAGSIAYARHIDRAAACMYALQHRVLPAQDIPVQGTGRQPYRS